MTSGGSNSCPQCGAPVSTAAGRCPFCGFTLGSVPAQPAPQAPTPPPTAAAPVGYSPGALHYGSARPPRPEAPPPSGPSRVVLAASIAGAMALAAVATLLVVLRSRSSPTPVASAPPPLPRPTATAPSDVVTIDDPKKVDPSHIYPRVYTKAVRWYSDARLLSIEAGPVIDKNVDLTASDGKIVYTFFAWKKDVAGSHKPESGDRLVVTVTSAGAEATPTGGSPTDEKRMVDEPTCVAWDAMRTARASGVPADQPIVARYDRDAVLARGIWHTTVAGHKEWERYIDGQTCAVVRRR